ncbi:MAG: Nif3-like dinuclear metal center hexameric protein [Desulfovibrionaceae bacterium]
MKDTDLIGVIENIAPLYAAASWDSSGMQVAAVRDEIRHVALCLDPTPASVSSALAQGADFICSHHPLLLHPRLPAHRDAYHKVLSLLLQHDVALYAAHTSLDVNPDGPAGWLSRSLQLQEAQVIEPTGTQNGRPLGFGLVGNMAEALSLEALTRRLGKHIPMENVSVCGPVPAHIRRIAYCTGSGSSLLPAVTASHADIYITGDVKYHTALETTTCILDVGHHSLEEEMMRHMSDLLRQSLPHLTVTFVSSVSPLRVLIQQC